MAKNVKASKAVVSTDVVNPDLKAQFEGVVNLEAELAVYEKAVAMLNAGSISVRGLKATIEAAQEKGALPTIKPSTAQYFVDSAKVRALAGGKDKPLKAILNATIQAKRAKKTNEKGKEVSMFEDLLAGSKSFADLVKATPKQGTKITNRATLADVKAVMATADGVVALALNALRELSGDEAVINNVANAKALINALEVGMAVTRHPSAKAKVSA